MERSISQRFTAMLLCVCLMIGSLPFSALHGYASKNERSAIGELDGYLQGALQTVKFLTEMERRPIFKINIIPLPVVL